MVFLKGCLYVGASLHILGMSYGFGGRTGFDVNMSRVSSECAGSYHLVRLELEGLGSEPGVSWGFLLLSDFHCPIWGWGQVPTCWSRIIEVWVQSASFSFKCVHFSLPAPAPSAPEGSSTGVGAASVGIQRGSGCGVWQSGHHQKFGLPLMSLLCNHE